MIVKDAMVLIHLAKLTLLAKSCEYFKPSIIPKMVYYEILAGKERGYSDAEVVLELIKKEKIIVKDVRNKKFVRRAEEFNIQRGEAEALAMFWQEKADYLATDDDNVRKKSALLELRIIGTPAIVLKLYKEKMIEKKKFINSLFELRKIGWYSNALIDKIVMEGLKWENR